MEAMPTRKTFGQTLKQLGQERDDFVVLDADISKSTYSFLFHEEFPERAYNLGIAEQNMMGVAAGFASTGIPVVATTYAVFASMRALEQVRTFICYPDLNVKIAASHGGLQVSSDGVSHQGLEDIAIMRAIPNMTVVHPADPFSTKEFVKLILDYEGPVYLRLLRNAVPVIYDENTEFVLGKGIILKDHKQAECTIFACGLMVAKALKAAAKLREENILTRVVDLPTLKPIDEDLIIESAQKTKAVVTAEDHNIVGGLGGAVSEILGEKEPVPIKRIGVKDEFGESGDAEKLFTKYGMNVEHIVQGVKGVIKRK
ncbi:MAG: transketolase family protein [bacterium]